LAAEVDRRSAFGQIAVGAALLAGLPQVASADGATSKGTIQKARFVYGGRIADLKKAVESGDFDAVAAEKSAFILFNSGAYPGAKYKPAKNSAIQSTNDIFSAIRTKDKAGLNAAYKTYVSSNDIRPMPVVDVKDGQGYSGDFDYRRKTSAGAIYQR
jgi:hypothetical protein